MEKKKGGGGVLCLSFHVKKKKKWEDRYRKATFEKGTKFPGVLKGQNFGFAHKACTLNTLDGFEHT